jgi:capsid assembly protease
MEMRQVRIEGEAFEHEWRDFCIADYVGPWMMEPMRARALLEAVKANGLPTPAFAEARRAAGSQLAYSIDRDGVAHMSVSGVMMKPVSKTGGTSTIMLRRALRMATADPEVRGVLIHGDSPGGTADGTAQLAEEVRKTNDAKPVHVYIDDVGASAFLYATAHAERITALSSGWVGSVGSIMVVTDQSAQAEEMGLKVIPLVSAFEGEPAVDKARFRAGTEVTEEDIAFAQRIVQASGDQFYEVMRKGRGLSRPQMNAIASGAAYPAPEAVSKGLADAVGTSEDAHRGLLGSIKAREAVARQKERQATVKGLRDRA